MIPDSQQYFLQGEPDTNDHLFLIAMLVQKEVLLN